MDSASLSGQLIPDTVLSFSSAVARLSPIWVSGIIESTTHISHVGVCSAQILFNAETDIMTKERYSAQTALLEFRSQTELCLSLVIPVYNEAAAIGPFLDKSREIFPLNHSVKLDMVFVNDGSTDSTLQELLAAQNSDPSIRIMDLSRNFGKEAALTAGLESAIGDVIVPLDVDLQDPLELIPEMITQWRNGYDVVLAKRSSRDADSWVKRKSAVWFYNFHNKISETKIPENVGDFRLMDRMVIDALKNLPESRRFMKGLFAWAGFRTTEILYSRPERVAGKTKFSGFRLWNLALEGITSFSTAPLRIWTYLGGALAILSVTYAIYIVIKVIMHGIDVPGYASVMVAVTFLGGIQLMGIGIIGEYLGRTYIESKQRPIYLIRKTYNPYDKENEEC